ncbi:repeat protein [Gardnerella pickettii JCP7659]|uniref:InlB B-repeat-containing protein n=1 Tax=Gardnerella pickettii TaxID=2914924 RepID=UPI000354735D|nr:InlB B-repeat-containing protein [Gardnerella pickettii]EPI55763.1 repeat protein [Gardnerella pickettii JCP7659]
MNKKTAIVLSTTMMSIATAACAFCIAQAANAAENNSAADVKQNVTSVDFSNGGGEGTFPVDLAKSQKSVKSQENVQNDISAKSRDLAQSHASKQSQEIIRKQKSDSEGHESNFDNADSSSGETRLTPSSDYSGSAVDNKADKRNDPTDAGKPKNDEVSTQKSVKATKDDRASADSPANVDKQSEVKPNKDGIYDFSNDKDIKNPFPNVITPAEVKELQDKTKSVSPLPFIQKNFYTAYGKNFSVKNGQAFGDTKSIDEIINTYSGRLGRIDIFIFVPRVDKEGVYTGDGQFYPYRSSRELKNSDGSVDFDLNKAPDEKLSYKLEVNGRLIGSNIADKTNIKFQMRKNQTFIHVVMEGSADNEAIFGYEGLNHEQSSGAPGYFAFVPECGAQFHFVDDLKYRKTMNLSASDNIPQRSASETDKFSTKPFIKLDLSDLSDAKNISEVRFGNNQVVRNMYTPLLSYEGDPKKDSIKRPTMEELKNANISGYLYYSNDIDTPNGGKFTKDNTENFGNYDYGIARDKDDNQLTVKHYYVTFRPIPTQLVVRYKNLQNKIESGKQFALYVGNKQIAGDFKSAESSAAPELNALQSMITNKNTALLSEAAGYLSNGFAYLSPGNYIVKSAAEAPTNYEWVVEPENSADINSAPIDAKFNIAVHKDNSSSTQKVVTFVLRRKIATVTFFDGDDSKPYATVAVQKGSSINGDELKNQSMPKDPTKPGFTFNGWFTEKDGKGTKFTGNTTVRGNISVHSSYISNPPAPEPEQEPEPNPVPVPELPIPVSPDPILPPAEAEPEPAPAPSRPTPEPKHVAKHLPETGSTATTILASAIASLFSGLVALAADLRHLHEN